MNAKPINTLYQFVFVYYQFSYSIHLTVKCLIVQSNILKYCEVKYGF